jgi:hypothetical protein
MRIRVSRTIASIAAPVLLGGALLLVPALTAIGHAGATGSCGGDPYRHSAAELHACGIQTYPLLSTVQNADGSTTYTYNVEGDVTTYRLPPAGFDFTKATQAQLDEYNIPPGTNLSNLKFVTPPPFFTNSTMSDSWSSVGRGLAMPRH